MSFDFHTLAMPGIADLAPYVPGKPLHEVAREFGLTDVVKLASNECPIGCSAKVTAHLQQQLSEIFRYPDGDGLDLKQALANKLSVEINKISLGNGSNDILEFMARIFAGPDREIIYSQFGFAVYRLVTQVVGAKGIEVPAQQWGHDLDAMAAAVTDRTRVIYIANPNNPTGTWLSQTDIEAFLGKIPAHVIVVLDEAYFEYVDDKDFPNGIELVDRYPQLVVTRTFSKIYGLAGLRVGYSISQPEICDLINRVRQPFNVNLLAQSAAIIALEDEKHVQTAREINSDGKQQCYRGFDALKLDYIPSYGNFISVDVNGGDAVFNALLPQGVIVRPMASYDMPQHIRVTIGTAANNKQFLSALERVLERP